jgi:small conductance mechanosensitive channel
MSGFKRFRPRRPAFESRTELWRQVGLGAEVDRRDAQRARGTVVVLAALIAGVMIVFANRSTLFPGMSAYVRFGTVAALVILGWWMARSLGRGLAPSLFRRMEPGTAGIVGFLIRLATIVLVTAVALRIAGVHASTLAVGGAFTAVIVGLAAQQTLGNLFAGLVLLSTRPFRVGERVRLTGGALAGSVQGIVSSLGLFYTNLVSGADPIMVPNSMMLNVAVIPLREPERVELRARFSARTTPHDVQELLAHSITVPTRYSPHVELEELDHGELVVRVVVTPMRPSDGSKLASQVLSAVRNTNGAVATTA